MARNRNREFSEGNGLNPRDLGKYAQDTEERLPSWGQRQEEDDLSSWQRPAQKMKREREDADLPEPAPDLPQAPAPDEPLAEELQPDAAPGPEQEPEPEAEQPKERDTAEETEGSAAGTRERIVQTRADKTLWDGEPEEGQRVESGVFSRRNAPSAGKTEEEPAGKKKGKGKKAAKKPADKGKKGKKSKKKKTQEEERQSFLRMMLIILLCGGLFLMAAVMVLSNFVKLPILSVPQKLVTSVVAPIQTFFSTITDNVVDYLRLLKVRGNIEYEYEQLRVKLDEYATDSAMMEELRRENESLQALVYEHQQPSHAAMNPIGARVIGTVGNNYFSTLTLNVGTENGVTDYMAVVSSGGLVGVTYNVKANQCDVRCIIDSDCTVAGLVQSSRDQGSVKGTLGTNGEPMCRMYYLPDNSLPRPGDVVVTSGVGLEFPKGIPIGYIRESTRGMEENKSYVVLEPVVDFQHLEYVTVYRYRPSYAEDAQTRVSTSQNIQLEPLTTARPVPTFALEGLSDFIYAATSAPGTGATATPEAAAAPTPTPRVTSTPDPHATALPPNLEYVAVNTYGETPSPSPRPTFTPTPSPVPTSDPGAMTVEEDE
ncbi:MAG: rod shape-determining protein MreC [Clostridia bacterium]|nr:rod shape-determining protein MreC [Clostridia bacterium]